MALKIDYSLRLPDGEFFPAARKKSGMAIHHTVGGTADSTFDYWLKDRTKAGNRRMVGTAFIIDRDGCVYQVFEPTAWAFQFGVKWPPARQMKFEQRFIGIELASEGGLTEFNGKLYCFDRISPKTQKPHGEAFDHLEHYRGYRYFDKYEPIQIEKLVLLINHLCDTYVRLSNATSGGHKIGYQLLVGSEGLVKRLAAALGLEHVTPSTLQVPNG